MNLLRHVGLWHQDFTTCVVANVTPASHVLTSAETCLHKPLPHVTVHVSHWDMFLGGW